MKLTGGEKQVEISGEEWNQEEIIGYARLQQM